MAQHSDERESGQFPPPPAPPPEFFTDSNSASVSSLPRPAAAPVPTPAGRPNRVAASPEAEVPPAVVAGPQDFPQEAYAEFGPRFVATSLDGMLIGALDSVMVWGLHADPIFTIPVFLLYRLGIPPLLGTTPGCRAAGIRLVSVDGKPTTAGQVTLRTLVQFASSAALGLGYLAIFGEGRRQTWHDRAAGTYVVHEDASPIGVATDLPARYSFSPALAALGLALMLAPRLVMQAFAPTAPAAPEQLVKRERVEVVEKAETIPEVTEGGWTSKKSSGAAAEAKDRNPEPAVVAQQKAAPKAKTQPVPEVAEKESSLDRLRRELLADPNEAISARREDLLRTFDDYAQDVEVCKAAGCYHDIVDDYASRGRKLRETKVSDFTRDGELKLVHMMRHDAVPDSLQTAFTRSDNQDIGIVTLAVRPPAQPGKPAMPEIEVATYWALEGDHWRLETGPFERPARKR